MAIQAFPYFRVQVFRSKARKSSEWCCDMQYRACCAEYCEGKPLMRTRRALCRKHCMGDRKRDGVWEGGLPGGTRTPDLLLRRQLLYPVELRVDGEAEIQKRPTSWAFLFSRNGRSGGIRTRDPLLPKQMRYQAALRSDKPTSIPCGAASSGLFASDRPCERKTTDWARAVRFGGTDIRPHPRWRARDAPERPSGASIARQL